MEHGIRPDLKNRRRFLRDLGIGSMSMCSGGLRKIVSCAYSNELEPRLVVVDLKSWRSNPRLQRLDVAFRFLEGPDLKTLPPGKHQIDDNAYALIEKSRSMPPESVKFEVHRRFVDVHYLIAGQMIVGFAPVEKLKEITPYEEETDIAIYAVPAMYRKVELYPGKCAVFFTGGGHMPNCHLNGGHDLHKIVVKVPNDYKIR